MTPDLQPQVGDRWQRAGQHDIVVIGVEKTVVLFQQQDRKYSVTTDHYQRLAAECQRKGDTLVRKQSQETEEFLFE